MEMLQYPIGSTGVYPLTIPMKEISETLKKNTEEHIERAYGRGKRTRIISYTLVSMTILTHDELLVLYPDVLETFKERFDYVVIEEKTSDDTSEFADLIKEDNK